MKNQTDAFALRSIFVGLRKGSGLRLLKTEARFRIIPVLSFIVTLLKVSLLK